MGLRQEPALNTISKYYIQCLSSFPPIFPPLLLIKIGYFFKVKSSVIIKGTSSNSWMASKGFKKPTSALKILQIAPLFTAIFALNSTF